MSPDEKFVARRRKLAARFEKAFGLLLKREPVDFRKEDLSLRFDLIATNLFADSEEMKDSSFDGADDLDVIVRKTRQAEFQGKMWMLDFDGESSSETFRARITDKQITKQGIWIEIWIGSNKAEGDLSSAFALPE